jgi:hypothetical protein
LLADRPGAAGNADGLYRVSQAQSWHGEDLESADLVATVAALAGVVGDRHLPPGQGRELAVQVRLVALDHDQVAGMSGGEVFSVLALGMQRIGGDHGVGQVEPVQRTAPSGSPWGSPARQHREASARR